MHSRPSALLDLHPGNAEMTAAKKAVTPKFHSTRVEIDSILLLFGRSQNQFYHYVIYFFRTN